MAGKTLPDSGDRRRIGVVGIVVTDRGAHGRKVQEVLAEYADLIVGRMGIPYRERGVSVISLIVDGDTDRLGAFTGRLGVLPGTHARSALTSFSNPPSTFSNSPGSPGESDG